MRIKELKINTRNLTKQTDFYADKIGLALINKSDNQALFSVGKSNLKIVEKNKFSPYHFAINIPCNKANEALEWLKKRVEIIKDGKNEIQDFNFWNAKAVYFYDTDNNIVELIARKNLKNESQEAFNRNSLLEISEIGMPVINIENTFNSLNEIADLDIYDGNFERFCAIGDENGLFICINKSVKDWYPTGDRANSSEFEVKFEANGQEYELEFINEQIKAIANKK